MSWIAGFIATTAGKTLAGAAVAATSMAGLNAAHVDLPVLPDQASDAAAQSDEADAPELEDPVDVDTDDDVDSDDTVDDTDGAETDDGELGYESPELPEQALAGKATAEANRTAANAFTTAMGDWTDCVSENAAAAHGDDVDEEFDPRADCGDKPAPADFRPTEVPEQANDAARDRGVSDDDEDGSDDDPAAEGQATSQDAREGRGAPANPGANAPGRP